jgi:hypothetical protein
MRLSLRTPLVRRCAHWNTRTKPKSCRVFKAANNLAALSPITLLKRGQECCSIGPAATVPRTIGTCVWTPRVDATAFRRLSMSNRRSAANWSEYSSGVTQ